jgi:hypothetical protein
MRQTWLLIATVETREENQTDKEKIIFILLCLERDVKTTLRYGMSMELSNVFTVNVHLLAFVNWRGIRLKAKISRKMFPRMQDRNPTSFKGQKDALKPKVSTVGSMRISLSRSPTLQAHKLALYLHSFIRLSDPWGYQAGETLT